MIPKSSRTFSKRMVIVNCMLAWAAIFLSIFYAQAAYVAVAGMTLIAALGGFYMNVGAKDLALMLASFGQNQIIPNVPSTPESQIDVDTTNQ